MSTSLSFSAHACRCHPPRSSFLRTQFPHGGKRGGFTLTELLIAVVVLIIVILATSKIFGTAAQVTGHGQALADLETEAAVIERQMRDDIARLSYDGFFVIRNVAVANDVNGTVLVNPLLAPNAIVRADQLAFFVESPQSLQTIQVNAGDQQKAQATISRVYYGHGIQLPGLTADISGLPDTIRTHDAFPNANGGIGPWYSSTIPFQMVYTYYQDAQSNVPANYTTAVAPSVNATQPPANRWLLLRQGVILADDDDNANTASNKVSYLNTYRTAYSILPFFPAIGVPFEHYPIRAGRVDASAQTLNDIRSNISVVNPTTGAARAWIQTALPAPGDQRDIIASSLYYPRAERTAPSPNRMDQVLTNNVVSAACSSFIIEWTFADVSSNKREPTADNIEVDGIASADPDNLPGNGTQYFGVRFNPSVEHPWFGISDFPLGNAYLSLNRGVNPYCASANHPANFAFTTYQPSLTNSFNASSYPGSFEFSLTSTPFVQDYYAAFGYNQSLPLDASVSPPVTWQSAPNPATLNNSYTPWPSAIRVTMTLHDPQGRMESGREFQFIIDLPRRSR